LIRKEERDVEVRWHPDNIGEVTVYVGGQKFETRAVHPGFDGVTARQWLAARRELRGADPQRETHDRQIVLQAVQAIRDRSTSVTTLAGLIAEDWSPTQIKQEEDRLFISFDVTTARQEQPTAFDGMGQVIPDEDYADDVTLATQDNLSVPAAARPVAAPPAAIPVVSSPDMHGGTPTQHPWKITE